MRVAVTGGHGTLGRALQALRPDWAYWSRIHCDVRSEASIGYALDAAQPDVVVHAAALTDHQHPNAAEIIETNVVGTQRLALECRLRGVKLVYLSTHYVYPGTDGNYNEESTPRPIGAYAWSKYAGEEAVWAQPGESLVIRGSWYDYHTRLRHWLQRGALVDAWVSREPVADAARKIAALVDANACGTYNIGGARRTFAQILRDEGYADFPEITREQLDYDTRPTNTTPFMRPEYPFPRDVSVDTAKFDALQLAW